MTWPPVWTKPHFKNDERKSVMERRLKKMATDLSERQNKAAVRKRDKKCRFPLCECKKWRRRTEVSHREHKGKGGGSATDNMILLCTCRHRENRVSIHQGNLQWDPLTKAGADGPIEWRELHGTTWISLAKEVSVGQWAPFTSSQRVRLERLAEMDI
jgi:hypothetical protein